MEGRTLMNTTLEKALPGFLLLTDLASQIRIGRIINRGGNGILFEGFIVDPVLRSRAQEDVVAVKKIECKPAFLSSSFPPGTRSKANYLLQTTKIKSPSRRCWLSTTRSLPCGLSPSTPTSSPCSPMTTRRPA